MALADSSGEGGSFWWESAGSSSSTSSSSSSLSSPARSLAQHSSSDLNTVALSSTSESSAAATSTTATSPASSSLSNLSNAFPFQSSASFGHSVQPTKRKRVDTHRSSRGSSSGSGISGALNDASLVAFQVDALNQRDEFKQQSQSLEDELQSERISHAVATARSGLAATRNSILQKRVAELEKLRQGSKDQVKTLLHEMELRQQESDQAEAALRKKLAETEAKLKVSQEKARITIDEARQSQDNDAAQVRGIRESLGARVEHLSQRNSELEAAATAHVQKAQEAQRKLARQEEECARLSKQFAALKDRRELLAGDSLNAGSISASDVSLDARVRQLAQEARFNARLRAQQQRIRELVEQNKVLVQTQMENDRLNAEMDQLEKRRKAANEAAEQLETELRRQKRQQEVWQTQWRRLFGSDATLAPQTVAKHIMELRSTHISFQDRLKSVEAELAAKTKEADDLEAQVIELEEKQEKLEDTCEARLAEVSRLKHQVSANEARNRHQLEHIQNLLQKIRSMRDASGNETSVKAVSEGEVGTKSPTTAGDSLSTASDANAVSSIAGDDAINDDDDEVITFSDSEL